MHADHHRLSSARDCIFARDKLTAYLSPHPEPLEHGQNRQIREVEGGNDCTNDEDDGKAAALTTRCGVELHGPVSLMMVVVLSCCRGINLIVTQPRVTQTRPN